MAAKAEIKGVQGLSLNLLKLKQEINKFNRRKKKQTLFT